MLMLIIFSNVLTDLTGNRITSNISSDSVPVESPTFGENEYTIYLANLFLILLIYYILLII